MRHTALFKRFLILCAVLTVGVLVFSGHQFLQAKNSASASALEKLTNQSKNSAIQFWRPVRAGMEMIRSWALTKALNLTNSAELTAQFIPVLEALPQVRSLLIANEKGYEYILARRAGEGWKSYLFPKAVKKGEKAEWRRLSPKGEVLGSLREAPYPFRRSKWFRSALLRPGSEPMWIEPHVFEKTQGPVVTRVVSWRQDGIGYVAALSISLAKIEEFVDKLEIGAASHFFLYAHGKALIDFRQFETATVRKSTEAQPMAERDLAAREPLLGAALAAWRGKNETGEPFRFLFAGKPWWGLLVSSGEKDSGVKVGMLAQEQDLGVRGAGRQFFWVLAALAVFWAGLLVYARHHFRLERERSGKENLAGLCEAELRKSINGGENDGLEFKSTLRWNLKANKPGKEVELAVLKTLAAFLNTDGGTLFIGVEDDGNILGTDKDGFASDDKYQLHFSNVFDRHIGLEFSEYLDYAFKPVNGKKIFAVTCRKSARPVFLRHKNEELFYIRTGASTRQLTASQMLEYLQKK